MRVARLSLMLGVVLSAFVLAACTSTPKGILLNKLPDTSKKPCISNVSATPAADPDVVKTEAVAMSRC
jgi:starvation-inducible outer membrane lipoprotein